jgi:hypothetical protein
MKLSSQEKKAKVGKAKGIYRVGVQKGKGKRYVQATCPNSDKLEAVKRKEDRKEGNFSGPRFAT